MLMLKMYNNAKVKISFFLVMFFLLSIVSYAQDNYIVSTSNSNQDKKDSSSEEQLFMCNNFPFIKMCEWYKGMRFMAVHNDMSNPMNFNTIAGERLYEIKHCMLVLDSIEERLNNRDSEKHVRTYILFSTNNGDKFEYEYIGSKERLCDTDVFNTIDGLAYLNDVDKAKELLLDKDIYINHDYGNIESSKGKIDDKWNFPVPPERIPLKKYTPVRIVKVGVGDSGHCPVKIVFRDSRGREYYYNVAFSLVNGNKTYTSGMIYSDGMFDEAFSFNNPKLKYKNIPTSQWCLIQEGKVIIGMSKEACRLSWGAPKGINTTTGEFGVQEQWVYGDRYLYFKNGRLTTIQN